MQILQILQTEKQVIDSLNLIVTIQGLIQKIDPFHLWRQMSNLDHEAFIIGLSGAIESIDVAEPLVSESAGLVGSLAIAEQQVVSGIFAKVFEYLSQLGQFLPPKEVLAELIDKAIDAAIVTLAVSNPFIARVLGSPIVRDRLRAAIIRGLDSLFPSIEV